jgi:sec-independent protein translocase protein TatA
MPSLGPMEIVIILVIALIVVGPKKLPNFGRSLGSGMREFKEAITTGGTEPKAEEEQA